MGATFDDVAAIVPALNEIGILPDDVVGVFYSGSLARGWGNEGSDLDVHVVTEAPWPSSLIEHSAVILEPNTLSHEATTISGRRCDVEYWTTGQLEQLLEKVSLDAYEKDEGRWATMSQTEIGMLERLPYAVAADDGVWLRDVQERLAASAHRRVLTGISLRHADNFLEDAAGQLAAGDLDSAVLAARLAFNHTVDGLQAWNGQFGAAWPKWRARRMSLVESPSLSYEQYWSIETMRTYDPANPGAWVESVIRLCQRVGLDVEL